MDEKRQSQEQPKTVLGLAHIFETKQLQNTSASASGALRRETTRDTRGITRDTTRDTTAETMGITRQTTTNTTRETTNTTTNTHASNTTKPTPKPKPTFLSQHHHNHHNHHHQNHQQNNQRQRRITVTLSESRDQPKSTFSSNRNFSKSSPNLSIFDSEENGPNEPESESESNSQSKSLLIKNEIFSTEISFYCDLLVLNDLYAQTLRIKSNILPLPDWTLLFNGLDAIITTSYALIESMASPHPSLALRQPVVDYVRFNPAVLVLRPDLDFSSLFEDAFGEMEVVYAKYCKNNEAALLKVAEYTSHPETYPLLNQHLAKTRLEMQGKTTAWDLSSLLVKPFQRILKYPLLLTRLAECGGCSKSVCERAQSVAKHINDVKKRRDVAEKYVSGTKSVNVMHGISKKWNRSTQILKQIGSAVDDPDDTLFKAQIRRFESLQALLPALDKHVAAWTKAATGYRDVHVSLCGALETLYVEAGARARAAKGGDLYEDVKTYRKAWTTIPAPDHACREIQRDIAAVMGVFKAPESLVRKRLVKKLDRDRVEGMLGRGEKVDKGDRESADEYVDIHLLLGEEVPLFCGLVEEAVLGIAARINSVQAAFYGSVRERIEEVARRYVLEEGGVKGDFVAAMNRDALVAARTIGVLEKWTDGVWSASGMWTGLEGVGAGAVGGEEKRKIFDVGEDVLIELDDSTFTERKAVSASAKSSMMSLLVPTPSNHFLVRALFPFEAEMAEEVSIYPDEIILVDGGIERDGSTEWWYGRVQDTQRQGWFPYNFVERI